MTSASCSKQTGDGGEAIAALFLESLGYRILERGWRTGRLEVDILALSPDGVLHVVEVKSRTVMGSAARTVNAALSNTSLRNGGAGVAGGNSNASRDSSASNTGGNSNASRDSSAGNTAAAYTAAVNTTRSINITNIADSINVTNPATRSAKTTTDFAPEKAMTSAKSHRIIKAGQRYAQNKGFQGEISLDLIAVELTPTQSPTIRHYQALQWDLGSAEDTHGSM